MTKTDRRGLRLLRTYRGSNRAIPSRSARKVIHEYLEDITGYDYKDPKEYLEWHRRWTSVIEMAEAGKEDKIPDLLEYYREATRSMPLRQTIMLSLTRLKAREALPLFLADLDHKNSRIRLAAYSNFKAFYIDFPPPFDPGAAARVRRNQVTAIQKWRTSIQSGRDSTIMAANISNRGP